MLRISHDRLQELLEKKEIPAYKDNGNWKIPVKSLEEYIERRLNDA